MEKTIYIPGDLVMTNGIPIETKEGIVYQVTESNADKYAKVKDGNAFTELKGSVTLSNLKGKTIKDDGFLFCDSGAWVKDIVPYVRLLEFQYTHELQHLLFGLGLNSEMEV